MGSGDRLWATRLVEEVLDETLRRGEDVILARWLSVFPEEAGTSVPALCLAQGLMQFHLGHLDTVERLLERAERAFGHGQGHRAFELPSHGGMVADVPAAIQLLRSELSGARGDPEGTAGYARSALAKMAEEEHGPRFWARWLLAFATWIGGRPADAERAFTSLLDEGRAAPELYPLMSTGSTLARVQRARGKLGAALRTYGEGMRFATEGGRLSAEYAGEPHVGIAQVLYERDQLDDALRHVTEGIELCRQVIQLTERDHGLGTLAWIRQATGDPHAALEAMNEACRMYPSADATSLFNPAPSEHARLLLAQGHIEQAIRWVEERGLTEADEVSYPWERDYLVLARVLVARSEPDGALGLLERLDALAESQGRTGSLVEITVLRSLALQVSGNHRGALAALADALSLAQPEGYIRVFADEGPPMAALLRSLISAGQRGGVKPISGKAREHLNRVILAFRSAVGKSEEAVTAVTGVLEPLTKRELEVLRLIAVGRRNHDIARDMVVTLETVKKHVSHILGKLGASSRTQAVARARDLGLIS